jgi:hypothetical protein
LIPPLVLLLAHEARRFGARVVVRECGHNREHIDVFDAPATMAVRLWDSGFKPSLYRADHWRWCASEESDDDERPTTPPDAM